VWPTVLFGCHGVQYPPLLIHGTMKRFCVHLKFSKILFQERVGSRTHHYLSGLNMVFTIHV
jgi:hypothetical protein